MENFDSAAKIAENLRSIEVVGVSDISEAVAILDDISRRNNGTSGE